MGYRSDTLESWCLSWPPGTKVFKDFRGFFGSVSYYCALIPNWSKTSQQLTDPPKRYATEVKIAPRKPEEVLSKATVIAHLNIDFKFIPLREKEDFHRGLWCRMLANTYCCDTIHFIFLPEAIAGKALANHTWRWISRNILWNKARWSNFGGRGLYHFYRS